MSRNENADHWGFVFPLLFLSLLCLSSLYSFLLFHTFSEMFAIAVAWGMFFVVWNTRRMMSNSAFLFLGIAYFFVGFTDLLHTLAYKGMNVFPGHGANLPTQLWIAARYMESLSFLSIFFFASRKVRAEKLFGGVALLMLFLTALILSGRFPDCFVEGRGLTAFKKGSELIICLLLLASVLLLRKHDAMFGTRPLRMLIWAAFSTMAAEICFIFYISVYGLSNMLGHCFKILSFWFVYKAIIEVGLSDPAALLFREISQKQEALAQSEARFRHLFENMLDGLAYHRIVTDAEGRPADYVFLEANRAFEEHTGLVREAILGKKVTEALPGIENSEFDWIGTYGRLAIQGGSLRTEAWSEELGKWFQVSAFGTEKDCFAVILSDVSERRRMTEALRKHNEELEARVAERTAELETLNRQLGSEIAERRRAEALLVRRNQDLERSNQDLDDFAYITSHDLREPLRGIHNFASFLSEDHSEKLDKDGRYMLGSLMRLTERLENRIRAILHYSRIGTPDSGLAETDLDEVLREVLDSLRFSIEESRTEIRIPAPLPEVRCEKARMAEVFANLIGNALKYNDKSEKWVEIGWVGTDGHGGNPAFYEKPGFLADKSRTPNSELRTSVFYVRDNGIGVKDAHIDKMFKIFRRLHHRDAYGGGTGVGLTIVRKIIERHGGKLWAESEPGKGSTFYFTLEPGQREGEE